MTTMKVIAITVIVTCMSGCVGPKITPRPRPANGEAASIDVFRRAEFLLSMAPAIVAVDGIESASLNQNSWATIDVPSGSRTLSVRSWGWGQPSFSQTIQTVPGQRTVFEARPNSAIWVSALIPIAGFWIEPFLLEPRDQSFSPPYSNSLNQVHVPYQ